MVDISVNEFTVHWCGHSSHVIRHSPLFEQFHENLLGESNLFYGFVLTVLQKSVPAGLQLSVFREVAREDLSYLGFQIVKPVTQRAVLNLVNKAIK
jgi:hypothetical protein